jgi:predicted PurR-regulated permease PerM
MNTTKFPFYARVALVLFSIVLIFIILSAAANIFIPLMFALLIAILLLPLNNFLERKLRLGKTIAPLMAVSFFIAILSSFFYFLTLQIVHFADDIPALKSRFLAIYADLQLWLSSRMHITSRQQTELIEKSANKLIDAAGQSLSNVLASVSGMVFLLVFVFIFSFFILHYRHLLLRFVLNLFSDHNRSQVREVASETKYMINAYISGLVIEMLMIGLVSCSLLLIMDVRYPMLLGAMIALLNVIPYLGFYSALLLAFLVTFANSGISLALQASTALFIVHLIDSNVLFPRIIGSRVKMNPFITILAVIVGQYLWGVPGMFLFIPIAGIIKLICERVEGLQAWGILMGVEDRSVKDSPTPTNDIA